MNHRFHPYLSIPNSTRFPKLSEKTYNEENHSHAFCDCYGSPRKDLRFTSNKVVKIECSCGEDVSDKMDWIWDSVIRHTESQIKGPEVIFHPIYSQGTSIIRGNKPLELSRHHYWEIKILSNLSGTDVMIGVGTQKIDLESLQYKFVSALGLDDNSWGYSYRGFVQHNGRLKYYGKKFSQGCIIGVHLDLVKGNLEFYLNRKPLGRAYHNLPLDSKVQYYPMACSTSAKSSIKLINASSFTDNLQFNCMKVISKYPKQIEELQKVPGLKYLCDDFWFLQSKEKYRYQHSDINNMLLEDEALLCLIKNKKIPLNDSEERNSSTDDIYDITHLEEVAAESTSAPVSSDEEHSLLYFCDHY